MLCCIMRVSEHVPFLAIASGQSLNPNGYTGTGPSIQPDPWQLLSPTFLCGLSAFFSACVYLIITLHASCSINGTVLEVDGHISLDAVVLGVFGYLPAVGNPKARCRADPDVATQPKNQRILR